MGAFDDLIPAAAGTGGGTAAAAGIAAVPKLPADPKLTGDDFLKALDPATASQVKALAEGRMAAPSSFALKTPYWQAMQAAVSRYDPTFDMTNYAARQKTRNAFTSGKQGQNLVSLATLANHAAALDKEVDNTTGTPITPVNAVANWTRQHLLGDAGPNDYDLNAHLLANELETATGGSKALGAVQEVQGNLSMNNSTDAKHAAVQKVRELAASRAKPLLDQYAAGMGTTHEGLRRLLPELAPLIDTLKEPQVAAPALPSGVLSIKRVK